MLPATHYIPFSSRLQVQELTESGMEESVSASSSASDKANFQADNEGSGESSSEEEEMHKLEKNPSKLAKMFAQEVSLTSAAYVKC